jgi:tetratricopeptide (TPR) repeat protein/predicted Ser/Thr protein kinase
MNPGVDDSSEEWRRVGEVLSAYFAALEAGEEPDRQALLQQHPDLAAALADYFEEHDRFDRMVEPLRPVAAASAAVTQDAPTTLLPETPGAQSSHTPASTTTGGQGSAATQLLEAASTGSSHKEPPTNGSGTDPAKGTKVRYFGDYRLLKVLGRGGMGVVYRARQRSLNRLVAVKMIKTGHWASPAEVRRFRNEAEAVANLDHPQIVPIYEVGEHRRRHYFSMKLIEGPSLAERLEQYAADPRQAARVVAAIARAVHHAHQRGILHRDLKPSNILLDAAGQPHVTDFGLARRIETNGELSESGAVVGTPSYMSPEQAEGHRGTITTATDVYGLGAILYAALTGKPPFQADTVIRTLDQVRGQPPERPTKLNGKVPRDMEVICLKCLEKDPRKRYDSAAAVADDLERYLGHVPILARRVGPLERTWRWCQRHPAPAALAASLMLAVLVGSVASTALWLRAERNYRNEQAALGEAQSRLAMALEAIKIYYTGVSEDMLLKEPQMKSLRDKLLGTALDFYKKLQESLQDNPDPKAQADLAEAYVRIGGITGMVGSGAEATKALQKALEIRERLAAAYPDNDRFQSDLAQSLHSVSWDMKLRDRSLARGLAICERLAAAHPDVIPYQIALADYLSHANTPYQSYANQGLTEDELRRNGERLEHLVAAYPDVPEIRRDLGSLYQSIALHFQWRGEVQKGLSYGQRSREVLEGISHQSDSDLQSLQSVYAYLGWSLEHSGRDSEALSARRKALELVERMVEKYPAVDSYRASLAETLGELGDHQRRAGRLNEAAAALRRARGTWVDLDRTSEGYKGAVVSMDVKLGRLEYAMGRTDEASRLISRAVARGEEALVRANAARGILDTQLNWALHLLIWPAGDALVEVKGPVEPLRHARATFGRLEAEGKLRPFVRQVLVLLDERIAKIYRQAGRMDEVLETIRQIESELDVLRGVGPPNWYPYNMACVYAQLSSLVGRPGTALSATEQAEFQRYQDQAMEWFRRVITAGDLASLDQARGDPDFDPIRSRPDFQALVLDLAFPADPFAPAASVPSLENASPAR